MIADTDIGNEDNVTAYGQNDAPQYTAVATSGRRPYYATASGVTDEQLTIHNIKAPRRQPFTLGAWNVRTTNDSGTSIRPERATAITVYLQRA